VSDPAAFTDLAQARQGLAPSLLGIDPLLAEPGDTDSSLDPRGWNVERASRCVRHIAQLRKDQALECGAYEAEIERIAAMEQRAIQRYEGAIARATQLLRAWFEANRPESKRSWDLPAGRIGVRAQPLRAEVVELARALEWARSYLPDAVVVPAGKVDVRKLTEHLRRTGEQPAGCRVVGGDESFYVDTEVE